MSNFLVELVKDLKKSNGGHIFYHYNNVENYINHVVSYIGTGIKNGDHILLIENDRNIIHINKLLEKQLRKEQLAKVHFINNFDFYYSNGDFHPHTILNYFSKNIEPFLETDASICTWGHIEWGDDKEISNKIEEYETQVDKLVNERGLLSVCAYDANRTSNSLKVALMRCHGVMMTDDEVFYL